MPASRPLIVHAIWDDESGMRVATSEDVRGLATEAEDLNPLVDKLNAVAQREAT